MYSLTIADSPINHTNTESSSTMSEEDLSYASSSTLLLPSMILIPTSDHTMAKLIMATSCKASSNLSHLDKTVRDQVYLLIQKYRLMFDDKG